MEPMYYIGLDVHKRKISYCVKDNSGRVFAEGLLCATRLDLDLWMKMLPQPWSAANKTTQDLIPSLHAAATSTFIKIGVHVHI
jgi:transposase